jgi:hypothetical protein
MVVGFLLVGLATTWASCWIGSRMSFRWYLPAWSPGGCYEIGVCSTPWWATGVFVLFMLGPSVAFAITGWFTRQANASPRIIALRLGILMSLTVGFYLLSYSVKR